MLIKKTWRGQDVLLDRKILMVILLTNILYVMVVILLE